MAAALLFLCAVGLGLYVRSLAYSTYVLEAGTAFTASDLIKAGDPTAYFTGGSQAFDIHVPGKYRVKVRSGLFTHRATLYIRDTVAPAAQPVTAYLLPGETCSPEALVGSVDDATQVTATFLHSPDYSRLGSQPVDLILTDQGGNSAAVRSEIFISPVRYKVYWEAGSSPPPIDYFLLNGSGAAFVTDMAALDMNTVAEHDLVLSVDGVEYPSVLSVIDTVPPTAVVREVTGYRLVERKAEDFIVSVEDATTVTPAFVTEPDLKRTGAQTVELSLTDEGGNCTVLPVTLILEEDTEPPEIAGIRDLNLLVGETPSYRRGLRVTDNCPEGLRVEIDSSGVDLNKEGVYEAVYTATDLAGNTASASITVSVLPWAHSEEELNALADKVLGRILEEGMSPEEKLTAIHDYVSHKILYVGSSQKGNWSLAAYQGLTKFQGDCYTFSSTARLLLTRAGIENMEISKSDKNGNHWWNLVDIGDGWYHFDANPRPDQAKIILWTDERLMNYSQKYYYYSYEYDKSKYPEIN